MANLPLTGSQYWGAALNNYLRQLNTDITSLKLRLDNFTVSASYSGSGWVESTYKISPCTDEGRNGYVEALGDNTAVFELKSDDKGFNPTFLISGTLIFNNPATGRSLSVSIPESQNMKLAFGSSQTETDDLRAVHILSYKNGEYEVTQRDDTDISSMMAHDGYYPVYAIYNEKKGFIVALNTEQEFIFHENYVLLGIAMRSTDALAVSSYYFARKTDSALKSIYETRKGNIEAFATIINAENSQAQGLFQTVSGGLKVILSSATIDYHSNGISNNSDPASESDYDYKHPYDYKRFGSSGRLCYITKTITTNDQDEQEISDQLTEFSTEDLNLVNGKSLTVDGVTFEMGNIYGVYISALGNIVIEVSNKVDTISDLTGYTNDYVWTLNSDSNFRTGGLVFLGAFYHAKDAKGAGWKFMQPAINSISPAFISSKSVENANIVNLPDVLYLTYPADNVNQLTAFKYNIIPPTIDSDYNKDNYLLTLDAGYNVSGDTDNYRRYHIPLLPSDFYSNMVTDSTYKGIRLGSLLIESQEGVTDNNITSKDATCKFDTTGRLHCYSKIVSSPEASLHASEVINTYNNVMQDAYITGLFKLNEGAGSSGDFEVNRNLTNVKSITSNQNSFYIKAPRKDGDSYNLHLVGTTASSTSDTSFTVAAVNKVPDGGSITPSGLTLTGSTITLNASNKIVLSSLSPIEVGNTLLFTSDARCKKNIKDLSGDVCVNLVRNLHPKTFTYIDTEQNSMGVIAQELEDLCPEYKDLLVNITSTDTLSDKRNVAEIKLLFILWKAVQHLLTKEG